MRRSTESKNTWSLTLIRDGKQGLVSDLCEANYRYGRTSRELNGIGGGILDDEERDVRKLPSGLVDLIEDHPSQLAGEALETGFLVEMTKYGSESEGWTPFTITLMMSNPVRWFYSPHALYSNESGSTMEFQKVGCPGERERLPNIIWVKLSELPLSTIVWACENQIFSDEGYTQMSLNLWTDLPEVKPRENPRTLILPGPPGKPYRFI
ncbi:MAG: hypothetical protein CMB46_02005 [Euryarchaeota archaeon]|nr:hypothetical protein [Euryarchaeota archaeon]